MEALMEAQFQRIELAMNALIDSISAYNPSTVAADSLLEADDELSKAVNQLSVHNENVAQLATLRETTAALDTQITSILTRLSDTRSELLASPGSASQFSHRPVPYDSLLSYATHISKFTAPPGSRTEAAVQTNGATTSPKEGAEKGEGAAGHIPEEETQWLNPAANVPFVPWPSEDTIRRGALAQIQSMVETGVDPSDIKFGEDGQLDIKQDGVKAEGATPTTDQDPVAKNQGSGTQATRPGEMSAGRAPQKPAVFGGLDLYDPDDD
ncbi:MAG: hypothetical protein M1833_006775 [Piccolia ochrophora]|nr:MAG: hypothetical protein M1833_006775 [Piccolia ochrophora]